MLKVANYYPNTDSISIIVKRNDDNSDIVELLFQRFVDNEKREKLTLISYKFLDGRERIGPSDQRFVENIKSAAKAKAERHLSGEYVA